MIIGVIDQVKLSLFPANFLAAMRPPKPPPTIATFKDSVELCQRAFDLLTGDYIDWPIPLVRQL